MSNSELKPLRTIAKLINGSPVTIVGFGDSLTQGWMVRKGYMEYLEEGLNAMYPGCKLSLVNSGIPGDTADGGRYRLEGDVLSYSPDCVLVQFGLNDAFVGYSPESFRAHVEEIILKIKSGVDAETVLVTSSYIGGNRENRLAETFYGQLKGLAVKYSLPIALVHEYWKKRIGEDTEFRSLVQFDSVHPTTHGYRLMAEEILRLFRSDEQ